MTMGESADTSRLSILTLNCWGIPYVSANRSERIQAIGQHISNSSYDVCVLQEIWSQDDYSKLQKLTKEAFPHSYYFHSGVTGSGVCLFSRHFIEDVVINRYSLNGYAHKVHHGDWFGGKLSGLCSMKINNIIVHLYVTHVHAEYGRDNDEYLAHRVAQILELCQFIRFTRKNADITIVAGDMNVEPVDLGYRLLLHHGQLYDAWVEQKDNKEVDGAAGHTNGRKSNSYTAPGDYSKRIDYIFYSSTGKYSIECEKCAVTANTVPGKAISFSDHEGVEAHFSIFPSDRNQDNPSVNDAEREKTWEESLNIFQHGLLKIMRDQKSFYLLIVIGVILKLMIEYYDFPYGTRTLIYITKLIVIVGIAICLWMAGIMCRAEKNGMLSAINTVKTLKKARDNRKQQ